MRLLSSSSTLVVALWTVVPGVLATCGAEAPYALCCLNVAPFSSNSGVWGGICGLSPSPAGSNPTVGARCTQYSETTGCPGTTVGTCCKERIPGPSGQCALGAYCQGTPFPSSSSSSSSSPSPSSTSTSVSPAETGFPEGWSVAGPCVVLDSYSTLNVTWYWSLDTPAACASYCSTAPGGDLPFYTVAGVVNGNQCHCGYEYNPVRATRAYREECSVPCAGDASQTCGRGDRIQVYSSIPYQVPGLPSGWKEAKRCAVDDASRVLQGAVVSVLANNTPYACAQHCTALGPGYTYAGVEYGNECHCGTGYKGGVVPTDAPTYECDKACAGDSNVPCGNGWRIQIYTTV